MKSRKTPWTDGENNILLDYYYTINKHVLVTLLPNRSHREVRDQVFLLNRQNKTFYKAG